ncbi:MAG TPA: VOC family protein [Acidimicrobiales bacterium]|nr:VOC family protein [Acidimicrobiales bacterium]
MSASAARWSIRSVLVSVRDLTRSVAFYRDVLALDELAREGEVAVLGAERQALTVILRAVSGSGVRHGQQEVGPRAVIFDVGQQSELQAVADRLEGAGALRSRSPLHDTEPFEVVAGRDPDGLPLVFVSYESSSPLQAEHYARVALRMYGVDL